MVTRIRKMQGRILELREVFDEITCTFKIQATIWFDENPKMTLGDCEVTQN